MPTIDSPRHVHSSFTATVHEEADLVVSVAVAAGVPVTDEDLVVTVDDAPVEVVEQHDWLGSRLHLVSAVPPGDLSVVYDATTTGPGELPDAGPLDRVVGLRPSRYCPSDAMAAIAGSEFAGHDVVDLPAAVAARVNEALNYDGAETRPTDSALETWLRRAGVCRDYAHVTITFLRALGVPARLASAYAPGLSPMDFHAVAEAFVDDQWHVVDATRLAPRASMVRIATGRDAADTAFLTVQRGRVDMGAVEVRAVLDGDLPIDDPASLALLR
ncbi:transglutaminase-like domain-containing protein [Salsipaludibacter albus]|uniref:transglutaminase-like domain-containing protein n=1 Tax=Salsipaludibacter albus TaxID=2849650 RepID=UPI001EE3D364|nr:transglutaminase family protein [Salsipaludibacter albus]MBY5162441.1 transglutaminase family protein [Salsipaludibacter albus]